MCMIPLIARLFRVFCPLLYRHLPPSPRAKRGQRAGARRGWFLRYAQSETKQKSRPKKEPPQRKDWKKKGSKVEVPLRKKQTGKASPTPKRRRGCAAHAGESWRFLGGTRFSLCGRVELLRRMGRVTTAKDPTSAVLAGLWRSPSAGLAQGLVDTDTCPQAPARSAAKE